MDWELPEDLTALTRDDLATLEETGLAAFDALRAGELTDEAVTELEAIAEGIQAVRAQIGVIDSAAANRSARAEEIAGQLAPAAEEESEGEPLEGVLVEDEPAAVAASARALARRRPSAAAVVASARAGGRQQALPNTAGGVSLLAAAGAPGFDIPGNITLAQAAEIAVRRWQGYPAGSSPDRQLRATHGICTIRKPFDQSLTADGGNDMDVLAHARDASRLPGGSLTAAGGWCAPSETLYDLCVTGESLDGILSVPEINVTRGGIRWTTGPDFGTIFNSAAYFHQTEAQAIAGQVKPCFEIPCPAFQEARLDAVGLCLTSGILQNRAYPEVVQRFIAGALVAHQHKMNASVIASIVAGSTAVTIGASTGAISALLAAIDLQASDIRYKYRMKFSEQLEIVLPEWIRGVLRSDLMRRNGCCETELGDALLATWFADRNVHPSWVYDWQDTALGQPAAALTWPATVQFLMYPAGTWVKGVSDIIEISSLYDSTLLSSNRYVALFAEEGLLVAKMCPESRVVTVPICPDGSTGAQLPLTCPVA